MSKNKWQTYETPTAASPVKAEAPTLTKLEYFASLAFHAFLQTNISRSAIPGTSVDMAKQMIARLEEEQRPSDDTPPAA